MQEERRARRNAHARLRITRCAPLFERYIKFAFDRRGSRVIRDWIFHCRVIEDYALPSAGHLFPFSSIIHGIFTVIEAQPSGKETGTQAHASFAINHTRFLRLSREIDFDFLLIFLFQKIFEVFRLYFLFLIFFFFNRSITRN